MLDPCLDLGGGFMGVYKIFQILEFINVSSCTHKIHVFSSVCTLVNKRKSG